MTLRLHVIFQGLKQSIWVAGDTGSGNVRGSQPPPPPATTQRTYIRPSVRSLGLGGGPPYTSRLGELSHQGSSTAHHQVSSRGHHQGSARAHPDTYRDFVPQPEDERLRDEDKEDEEDGAGAGPWYVYECIPLLKNLAGFEEGSKKNSILTQFIKHMNQNAVGSVKDFISSDKSCDSGNGRGSVRGRGYLVANDDGSTRCCSTPWGGDTSPGQPTCYDQFAR